MPLYAELLNVTDVLVRDLSAGGCLLETQAFLRVGTIGFLDMEFDGTRRTEWFRTCRVQVTHGRSGGYLVGAEFLPLAAAGDQSLRAAVRRMRPVLAHGTSGRPGRLSGDPGKSEGARPDPDRAANARPHDLLRQIAAFPRAALPAEVGHPVAQSPGTDAPYPRESDKGEVHMKKLIVRLVRDDQGQDLIEYVLIGSFVSIGALLGATALGTELNDWYQEVADWVEAAF